jgi:hypothetical protein
VNPARTILAVFVGYLTLLIVGVFGEIILLNVLRGRQQNLGLSAMVGHETVALFAGIVAGAITARMAPSRGLSHASALSLTIISATVLATAISKPVHPTYPTWYPYALALLSGVGAFFGGALASVRRSQEGI